MRIKLNDVVQLWGQYYLAIQHHLIRYISARVIYNFIFSDFGLLIKVIMEARKWKQEKKC